MFQNFVASTDPSNGGPRISALRQQLQDNSLYGFIIPRSDAHRGEYVAPCDERLAWLTGFTGSAGFAVVTLDHAVIFTDGRYTVQVRAQTDGDVFEYCGQDTSLSAWLINNLPKGKEIAFDPMLHSAKEIEAVNKTLAKHGLEELAYFTNLVDEIWQERPERPNRPMNDHPIEFAGQSSDEKIADLTAQMSTDGIDHCVLSLPDSICWLLNMRGSDIPRVPLAHCFAILHQTGQISLFSDAQMDPALQTRLNDTVKQYPYTDAANHLETLKGVVAIDPSSAPLAFIARLSAARAMHNALEMREAADPCVMPKATKNAIEVEGARQAHLRDGAAMAMFLAWLDDQSPADLTEIDVVESLEGFRRKNAELKDISFDTICGSGPNGAIVHYRVTHGTNRGLKNNELLLVDSGGQYQDGTTDITRTICIGEVGDTVKSHFTLVLKGMITVSLAQFPPRASGRDIDALARIALWKEGLDYGHGTGHGVGSYLSVHEGPQGISSKYATPFKPGMIVSNEPGFYLEGQYGIRIENLVVVEERSDMLGFETLTFTPIDRRLIKADMLSDEERDWLNNYHRLVYEKISPRVDEKTKDWLKQACEAL